MGHVSGFALNSRTGNNRKRRKGGVEERQRKPDERFQNRERNVQMLEDYCIKRERKNACTNPRPRKDTRK